MCYTFNLKGSFRTDVIPSKSMLIVVGISSLVNCPGLPAMKTRMQNILTRSATANDEFLQAFRRQNVLENLACMNMLGKKKHVLDDNTFLYR